MKPKMQFSFSKAYFALILSLTDFNYVKRNNYGFAPVTKCKYQVMEPGLSLQLVSGNLGVIYIQSL